MAYNGNTIPLDRIIWKVMNHHLAKEISYEQAAEYMIDFIEDVGSPVILEKANTKVQICEYKGALPTNIMNIRGIRFLTDPDNPNQQSVAMRPSTDIYHESFDIDGEPREEYPETFNQYFIGGGFATRLGDGQGRSSHTFKDYTYTLQNNIIITSFDEGIVQIAHDRISTDENDFPLVPDQPKFKRGAEYYILYRYLQPMYYMGKIARHIYEDIQQQYLWYLGATQNELNMPSIDKAEQIANTINRLVINNQAHDKFFIKTGQKERVRRFH